MPATPISAYARYYQPGITKVYFCPSITTITAPTRAELNAGTDVTRQVRAIDGFMVAAEQIDTPDMASLYVSKIGGRTNAEDSSLTFYGTRTGADVRTLLPRGTVGFIVMLDGGDVAASKMDVYPVTVISIPKQRSMDEAFGIQVQFSITSEPAEDVTIPA